MDSGSFVNCTLLKLILYSCYPLSVTYRIHIYVYLYKCRGLCFLHLIYLSLLRLPFYGLSLSVSTNFYKISLLFISVTSLLYRFPKLDCWPMRVWELIVRSKAYTNTRSLTPQTREYVDCRRWPLSCVRSVFLGHLDGGGGGRGVRYASPFSIYQPPPLELPRPLLPPSCQN
jgi:hypothetical protein